MTICIAALCDNGESCVLASDLMTTAHFPIGYEFETDEVEKINKVLDNAYMLVSGDVLFANQVIMQVKKKCKNSEPQNIDSLVEVARTSYQEERMKRLVHTELQPRGLDLNTYYQNQQKLVPAIVQMIDQALKGANLGVEFIVAGKDEAGCHIYTVQNPGVATCHDAVGFVAIGSGGPHALYSLIDSVYKKSLVAEEVKDFVEKAKKRSEVAPGVGKGTKIITIQ